MKKIGRFIYSRKCLKDNSEGRKCIENLFIPSIEKDCMPEKIDCLSMFDYQRMLVEGYKQKDVCNYGREYVDYNERKHVGYVVITLDKIRKHFVNVEFDNKPEYHICAHYPKSIDKILMTAKNISKTLVSDFEKYECNELKIIR